MSIMIYIICILYSDLFYFCISEIFKLKPVFDYKIFLWIFGYVLWNSKRIFGNKILVWKISGMYNISKVLSKITSFYSLCIKLSLNFIYQYSLLDIQWILFIPHWISLHNFIGLHSIGYIIIYIIYAIKKLSRNFKDKSFIFLFYSKQN